LLDALIVLHLLLLTYWLGTDLGVFYASRFVLRPDLAPAARTVAARIMAVLDLSPRVCLVLMLPSGVSLLAADPRGAALAGGWRVAAVWVLSLAWLGLVLADFRLPPGPRHDLVRRLDLAVRCVLVAGLLAVAAYTLLAARPFGVGTNPRWLGGKVGLYALAMACGIAIRYRLRPFGPAFAAVVAGRSTPDTERTLTRSVRTSVPYVAVIWVCVVGAAVLGVWKPGLR
jgi:hypothetical protein